MPNEVFNRSGDGWFTWPVPAGVKQLRTVEVRGGGSPGSGAGLVTGSIAVNPSDTLLIYIGEAGADNAGATGGAGGAAGTRGGGTRVGAGGKGGNRTAGTGRGGAGGGSATAVWLLDSSKPGGLGKLLVVAGGAGGASGDDGKGGRGGAATGEDGGKGTETPKGGFTAATGGRQNRGGYGGISGQGPGHNGADAEASRFGKGGAGDASDDGGGGGGGSGFYSGGGGQSPSNGNAPGGGGAGGSNYTGGMSGGARSQQGGGGASNGSFRFFWQNDGTNQPPTPPSNVKVNDRAEQPGMSANSNSRAVITAKVFDSDNKQKVRLYAQYATNKEFNNPSSERGEWVEIGNNPVEAKVILAGLKAGTHYWVRLWSEDSSGQLSLSYKSIDFWTNRQPTAPVLKTPPSFMQFPATATIDFSWAYDDPDGAHQSAFALRYRIAATPSADARPWQFVGGKSQKVVTSATTWVIPGETFLANYTYEWQVRVWDSFDKGSKWSGSRQFSTVASTSAPELAKPENLSSIEAGVDHTFTWRHVNWRSGDVQYTADLRFRAWDPDIPDEDAVWYDLPGTPAAPGAEEELVVPAYYDFGDGLTSTFEAGVTYAWEARTYIGTDFTNVSQWSDKNIFYAIPIAGSGLPDDGPGIDVAAGPLGCGNNRVMVAERGGGRMLGEITPLAQIQWSRVRDDISSCTLSSIEFGDDCGELLANLRCWQHELVVFRDGVRVWEGPVVRIAYYSDHVEIEAKDVMTYVYRRVMRVGYNDTYLKVHGVILNAEGRSVVDRAVLITQNALGYDDPNILPYLTRLDASDDAHEARSIAAYQKTAWEEIDDLAATAGLDYTVVGRRIVYNDVHNPIGKLPVMRTGDFSQDPVVTEYGMSLCNAFFVSSNGGQWGAAYAGLEGEFSTETERQDPLYYPFVEMLASAYGESADDKKKTVTADKKVKVSITLSDQALRSIRNRWPSPLLVRVPDNSILSPDLQIGINQLVPGVWVPLQATNTLREVTQWQKLDSMTVSQVGGEPEQIAVVLSPAPLGSDDDPDDGSSGLDDGTST